jgi:drug/metabolite transporter (DMT)-like permease
MAALLAIASSLLFGIADFLGGMSARRIKPILTAATAQMSGLVLLLVVSAVLGGERIAGDLWTGSLAGAIGAAALTTFYFALSRGPMSVVAPISAVSAAIVPLVVGLSTGESPKPIHWVGISLALPAVVLIAREGTSDPDPADEVPLEETTVGNSGRLGLLAGAAAGIGFGLFVSVITQTSSESGTWPIVTARSTASVLLVGVALFARVPLRGNSKEGWRLAASGGLLDATSNILILEAGRRGMLALVGVIGALYPASTILLARIVLHERLQRHQILGLGLGGLAVVLIALP